MGRRRLVVLLSAISMILIGLGVVGSLVAATQSDGGRDWIRRQVERQLAGGIKGKLHVGRLTGSFLTDLAIDSVLITDPDDSLFIALGPTHVTYDPRDFFDGRVILRSVELEHPVVVMRKENDDRWNYRKVFPPGPEEPPALPRPRSAFGALIVFQNVHLRGLNFQLTLPWQPDDSLTGARRDSAIAVNVADKDNEIRRVTVRGKRGLQHTLRWNDLNLELTRLRFRHPDSTGRQFDIVRLDVKERAPPFAFRNIRGALLWKGDTITLDFPHLELPNSVARARGRIEWGNDQPIRWDINVHSDSVGLVDVAWINKTMPRTGIASMDLHVKSQRDPHVTDYVITNMDARTDASRLRGAMTWTVGGPVVMARDFDLRLEPVDFALLRTFHGGPFPTPWNGAITGTLLARGGPLNHFQLDDAVLSFADANVPGATTKLSASGGELNLLDVGNTRFRGVGINFSPLDLRTPQCLSADFPTLKGELWGTATLDSIWTDVRFSDGDFIHRDGAGAPPSHLTGSGRLTLGERNVTVDLALNAERLSATTVARSYPSLPFRGDYSGPLRVRGSVTELSVVADLTGEAGRLQVDGVFGLGPAARTAAARGSFADFDVRRAFGKPELPTSALNGRFALQLAGDSLANLTGTAELTTGRSLLDSVRIHSAAAALAFGAGKVRVDSLRVESVPGTLTAHGGLGLADGRIDTLSFLAVVDSLGGLRRYLGTLPILVDSATGASLVRLRADSLDGALRATGALMGSMQRPSLRADLQGTDLQLGITKSKRLAATVALATLRDSVTGMVDARFDTLTAAGAWFTRLDAHAALEGLSRGSASATGETRTGALTRAHAAIERRGDSVVVHLDTLALQTTGNAWRLGRAATISAAAGGVSVDSLVFAGRRGSRIVFDGRVPADSGLAFALRADSVPLADVAEIFRTDSPLEGTASVHAELHGSRARPDIYFNGNLRDALVAGWRLDRLVADGRYADRRLTTSLEYLRAGHPALHAQARLPLDLAFDPTGPRLLEEPITGRIRTDSVGLSLLETFSKTVSNARGALSLDLDLAGTWKHPLLTGSLVVGGGALTFAPMGDVDLNGLEANILFLGDSIDVRTFSVRSGPSRNATADITGFVGIRDISNPTFALRLGLQGFNFVKRPRFVDLDLTGLLSVTGSRDASELKGSLFVPRGRIFVPDLYQKRVISLDDPGFYSIVDTSAFVDRRLFDAPSQFTDNLVVSGVPVQMGPEVWLKSNEANINLGGLVNITRGRVQRGPKAGQLQPALEGTLQTVRGTYRLNLGPVQRPFVVEGGDVRFFGDPELDGQLNINALYTVRQLSAEQGARPDVRVRVHIGGTLLAPTAELSSPDSLRVTNADLISYLVTGAPSYQIGGRNSDYASAAYQVLLSSSFSRIAAKATGGFCDDAQLTAAGVDSYAGHIKDVSGNILQGTRFNCAKQIGEKTFVRLDYGACRLGQLLGGGTQASDASIADALGVKLDYRLGASYTASLGLDPPTAALLCSRELTARGFAFTPRQIGFDLFRYWRF